MGKEKASSNRLLGLDALRGYAAMLVVLYHLLLLTEYNNDTNSILTSIILNFDIAVPLFFALSSFSLLYGYENDIFNEISLKKFYLKRFFRISPLFYSLIIFYLVVKILLKHPIDVPTILSNLTYTFTFIATKHESIVGSGWSLGVEWIFYAMFPLFVILIRKKTSLIIMLMIFMFISVNYLSLANGFGKIENNEIYTDFLKNCIYFVVGAVAYKTRGYAKFVKIKLKYNKIFGVLYVCFTISLFPLFEGILPTEIIKSLFIFLIIFGAIVGLSNLFVNRLTLLLGKISFSLYLLNPIIINVLKRLKVFIYIKKYVNNTVTAYCIGALITMSVITIVACLTYKFIEQPGVKIGKRIIMKMKNDNHTGTSFKNQSTLSQ